HGGGQGWRRARESRGELLRHGKLRKTHRFLFVYSAAIFLARATAVQCANSSAMYLPNCCGVIGMTVSASALNLSRSSEEARTLLISWLSFSVMASGSFAGPTMPYQVRPSKPS